MARKDEIDRLDAQIAVLQKQRDQLQRKEDREELERLRAASAALIVCPKCSGTGSIISDHHEDPVVDACPACGGEGCIIAVRWPGKKGNYFELGEQIEAADIWVNER